MTTPRADINPEGFLPPPTGCTCGNLYTYGGHTEPGQLRPECPVHGDAARTVTAEQLDDAAGALFEEACGGAAYEALDEGAARTWRVRAAVVLRAAGFTVPEEEQA